MSRVFFDEATGNVIVKGLKVKPGQMDLLFRNFSGKGTETNEAGKRNFCVKISEEDKIALEEKLQAAGLQLNIKEYNGEYHFKIIVRYGNYPPTIIRKKALSDGRVFKTVIDEDNVGRLDKMLIADGQLSCSPSYISKYRQWSCYLNSFIFTPLVDPVQEEIDALDSLYPTEEDEVPFE